MAQCRQATSSGGNSAVHLHLSKREALLSTCREDPWFERGVNEATSSSCFGKEAKGLQEQVQLLTEIKLWITMAWMN